MAYVRKIGDVLQEMLERSNTPQPNEACVRTGLADLDEVLGGFRPGTVSLLAARPSMGKTALGMQIALHTALSEKKKSLYVAMGIPADALAGLMLTSTCRIDGHRLRRGRLSDAELQKLPVVADRLKQAPLYITAGGATSVDDVETAIFGLFQHGPDGMTDGPALVVIDAIEDLLLGDEPEPHEEFEPAERREVIMQNLVRIAREYHTALLVLGQVARKADKRIDHRPRLADLPYLRQTEPYADTIIFLMRAGYYASATPHGHPEGNAAEITVAKSRFGMTGVVQLDFDRTCLRFATPSDKGESVCRHASDDRCTKRTPPPGPGN